jgi:uncharacterized protein (TIGR03435 family)
MGDQKFELNAVVPLGTTPREADLMLQDALDKRFHLAYHRALEHLQGFELVVAKGGAKLRSASGAPDPEEPTEPRMAADGFPEVAHQGASFMGKRARIRYQGKSMTEIAAILSRYVKAPVVDRTGLAGAYDFELHWDLSSLEADPEGPTLFEAISSQLGLKLEGKKVDISVFVVDRADKSPAPN